MADATDTQQQRDAMMQDLRNMNRDLHTIIARRDNEIAKLKAKLDKLTRAHNRLRAQVHTAYTHAADISDSDDEFD